MNAAQSQWSGIDEFLSGSLLGSDPVLDGALEASAAAGLPSIQITPCQGKLLQILAQLQGARSILEIGTLGGYSAIWLARALPAGGRVVTLEIDPRSAAVARANLARAGLESVVEVRVGRALDSLDAMIAERHAPFDLVFIDADKTSNADYFRRALDLSHPGSLIVIDNAVRGGAIVDAGDHSPDVEGTRRVYQAMAAEPRVSATAIQTVGSKGYDGFAIARVL